MKKILNHIFDMIGYAIGSIILAWVCFGGITMIIETWQRPWSGFEIIWFPIGVLLFGGLSILIGCFSIFFFIGIFKAKAWGERPKGQEKKISQVARYQNFGQRMIYESKENKMENSISFFCFFELENGDKFILIHNELFHMNQFKEQIIDSSETVVQSTNYIPWEARFTGFLEWFNAHFDRDLDPLSPFRPTRDRIFYFGKEYFVYEKGQKKVITDFYKEYIRNNKYDKTDITKVC
jgi:hypothetical protein